MARLHPRGSLNTLHLLATLCLAACGGGSSSSAGEPATPVAPAKEVAPSTFQINPSASWKAKVSDADYYSGAIASVDLTALNAGTTLPAGTILTLQSLGSFRYDAVGNLSTAATGLFVNADGQPLAAGEGSLFTSPSSSADCGQPELGDTHPQDFVIPLSSPVSLTVPKGATSLHLSVSDCNYRDNGVSDDPIRVQARVQLPT